MDPLITGPFAYREGNMTPCEKCGSPVEYDSTRKNLCCICADVNSISRSIANTQLTFNPSDVDGIEQIGKLVTTTPDALVAIDPNMFISLANRIREFVRNIAPPVEQPKQPEITWGGKLMFKLRGYPQPRFEDLGVVGTGDQSVAMQKAKAIAEKLLSEVYPEKDQVENWEVKVRPVNAAT